MHFISQMLASSQFDVVWVIKQTSPKAGVSVRFGKCTHCCTPFRSDIQTVIVMCHLATTCSLLPAFIFCPPPPCLCHHQDQQTWRRTYQCYWWLSCPAIVIRNEHSTAVNNTIQEELSDMRQERQPATSLVACLYTQKNDWLTWLILASYRSIHMHHFEHGTQGLSEEEDKNDPMKF